MSDPITKDTALQLLEKAIAERGADFQYTDLFGTESDYGYYAVPAGVEYDDEDIDSWTRNAVPACILGVGLVQWGADPTDVRNLDGCLPGDADVSPAVDVTGWEPVAEQYAEVELVPFGECPGYLAGVPITDNAIKVLWAAQRTQDANHTWGEALAAARDVAALLDGQ